MIALFSWAENTTDAADAFPTVPNRARRLSRVFLESCFREFDLQVNDSILEATP
jgi:hypothetical protein